MPSNGTLEAAGAEEAYAWLEFPIANANIKVQGPLPVTVVGNFGYAPNAVAGIRKRGDRMGSKSISIKSNLAQEKVCECFNVDFFQAMKLIYGYDSTVTTTGPKWTNGKLCP
jgi:hypothetical protein